MLRPYDHTSHVPVVVEDRGDGSGIAAESISQRYISRRFTVLAGNNGGSQNFAISDNHTEESILVFVNGIRQVPHGDYTVTNDQVTVTLPTTLDIETFVDILELPL